MRNIEKHNSLHFYTGGSIAMKKEYNHPKLNMILIKPEDVISTSKEPDKEPGVTKSKGQSYDRNVKLMLDL